MPRRATGQLDTRTLADGTRAFHLRFRAEGARERETLHERRNCPCGCGGGWTERTATVELENTLARIRAGIWEKRTRLEAEDKQYVSQSVPTFHEYASWWLQAKIDGVLSDRPIASNTRADYRWRLTGHLLPFFGCYRLDEIDRDVCLEFKRAKLAEAEELRRAITTGADLRDGRGRSVRPLGLASIQKLLETLAGILDEAVEDGHIERNPARGKRLRVRAPKPTRSFLEIDELVALIDAAGEQDAPISPTALVAAEVVPAKTSSRVAAAASRGLRPIEIASELRVSKSTVGYHLTRLGIPAGGSYQGRRAICGTLGRSGVRASELCALRVGDVRLHDPDGARFRIADAKTPAGVREVQMSPELVEEFTRHFERLRRAGYSIGPEAHAFPNTRGGRLCRQRVAEIVHEAASRASEQLVARGMPPLPRTTPHTLRRTYISIALLANHFDVLGS